MSASHVLMFVGAGLAVVYFVLRLNFGPEHTATRVLLHLVSAAALVGLAAWGLELLH